VLQKRPKSGLKLEKFEASSKEFISIESDDSNNVSKTHKKIGKHSEARSLQN